MCVFHRLQLAHGTKFGARCLVAGANDEGEDAEADGASAAAAASVEVCTVHYCE